MTSKPTEQSLKVARAVLKSLGHEEWDFVAVEGIDFVEALAATLDARVTNEDEFVGYCMDETEVTNTDAYKIYRWMRERLKGK